MATKTAVGFDLHCPFCHEGGAIKLDLNDLRAELECGECSETIRIEAAIQLFEDRMMSWTHLKRFLEQAESAIRNNEA
jgi:hypothetical protein